MLKLSRIGETDTLVVSMDSKDLYTYIDQMKVARDFAKESFSSCMFIGNMNIHVVTVYLVVNGHR